MSASDVLYVEPNTVLEGPNCTQSNPCRSAVVALQRVKPNSEARIIHITGSLVENLLIDGAVHGQNLIQIVGPGELVAENSASQIIRVENNADVRVQGLTLTGTPGGTQDDGRGVLISNAHAVLMQTHIEVAGTAVSCIGGAVEVYRSTVQNNLRGIVIEDCSFEIANNFMVQNVGTNPALAVTGANGRGRLLFNTIADNDSTEFGGVVYCSSGGTSDCVGNILWNNGDYAETCEHRFSNLENLGDLSAGAENISIAPNFVDGNYHLADDAMNLLEPMLGFDLEVDFDGDSRPQGGLIDIGADEFRL